jgi:hypothetical protein
MRWPERFSDRDNACSSRFALGPQVIANLYQSSGRMKEAAATLRREINERAKLLEQPQADALIQMQAKYEAEGRQREIKLRTWPIP